MAEGCTARFAIDAPTLVRFIRSRSTTTTDGFPRRTRRLFNSVLVTPDEARQIRRWQQRGGTVTRRSAERLLGRHLTSLDELVQWTTDGKRRTPITRGEL